MKKNDVAIIGAGVSGSILAIHLLKNNIFDNIYLINQENNFGYGLAYDTKNENFLLNVVCEKMSIYQNQPLHFMEWLYENNIDAKIGDFIHRKLFGDYVSSELNANEKTSKTKLHKIVDTVYNITKDEKYNIFLSNKVINSGYVVLALGNFLKKVVINHYNVIINPIKKLNVKLGDKVLIVGTGLSMVDVAVTLLKQGNEHITAISKHGKTPNVHKKYNPVHIYEEIADKSILEILKVFIKHIKADKNNWRAVVDSIRQYTSLIWQSLPEVDKRTFLRHLQHYWNTARHRIAPKTAEIIDAAIKNNKLHIIKSDVNCFKDYDNYDVIINCTGVENDLTKVDSELLNNLFQSGLIKQDNLKLGIDANNNGQISETMFAIGPLLKGVLYETTAVPEIRTQAENISNIMQSVVL